MIVRTTILDNLLILYLDPMYRNIKKTREMVVDFRVNNMISDRVVIANEDVGEV